MLKLQPHSSSKSMFCLAPVGIYLFNCPFPFNYKLSWKWRKGLCNQIQSRVRDFLKSSIAYVSFPGGSDSKESACNAGDLDTIPGLGRSLGEGNGNLLQYSCLENSMYKRAWQATIHGVTKSDMTKGQTLTMCVYIYIHTYIHPLNTLACVLLQSLICISSIFLNIPFLTHVYQ